LYTTFTVAKPTTDILLNPARYQLMQHKLDDLAKNRNTYVFVIPAKAGIK